MNSSDGPREELLAGLLQEMLEEAELGGQPNLTTISNKHPELADEIRELWATAMIAHEFSDLIEEDSRVPAATITAGEIPAEIGDYELNEELGRGGMGVVYHARQKSLNRPVALKMMLKGNWASDEERLRFRSEAEAAARISHPNIVPVYEVGEHQGLPFFSMEFIDGTTLSQRLTDGPLSSREAARLLIPICRAIGVAHREGILHRDLKASNILIDAEGQPHVMDFGLAKQFDTETLSENLVSPGRLTHTGAILGTPGYMAPEQAAGQRGQVSVSTDVYSLGAILYAMLTGRPPFSAASPVDTVLMVLEQDPLPPRLLNQKVDPDLEMITLKCLQKPADLRYVSADALADDLEAFLEHEPISARSSQFTQILSRAFRETHHAGILENWGLLWMWHSLVLFVLCVLTNLFQFLEITSRWPYVGLWVVGLSIWAGCFWGLRRRGGPITFVERQIAHVWASSMCGSSLLFAVEAFLHLPVLSLSPVLGVITGMVFTVKAGILSGMFYVQAIMMFLTALVMAAIEQSGRPNAALLLFGVMISLSFFLPGLKYYRQSRSGSVG